MHRVIDSSGIVTAIDSYVTYVTNNEGVETTKAVLTAVSSLTQVQQDMSTQLSDNLTNQTHRAQRTEREFDSIKDTLGQLKRKSQRCDPSNRPPGPRHIALSESNRDSLLESLWDMRRSILITQISNAKRAGI